jgi:hypothetical protein
MKTRYIIGSISHSTMRAEDLIPRFCDTLDDIRDNYVYCDTGEEQTARHHHERINNLLASIEQNRSEVGDDYYTSDAALYDLDSLFDMLNEYAAPYFYFGAHPGDGADYGFWLSEDVAQDVKDNGGLVVNDTSEVPADYSGEVLHVNDHGNTTLYTADNGKLTEVWAIV